MGLAANVPVRTLLPLSNFDSLPGVVQLEGLPVAPVLCNGIERLTHNSATCHTHNAKTPNPHTRICSTFEVGESSSLARRGPRPAGHLIGRAVYWGSVSVQHSATLVLDRRADCTETLWVLREGICISLYFSHSL
eukprot:2992167-Rhodomonas_salina.1